MNAATATAAPLLVYFSSISGNTARFIEKLGLPARRIPLHSTDEPLVIDEPFVLVTPTYGGGGRGGGGASRRAPCPSRSSGSSTTSATGDTSAE